MPANLNLLPRKEFEITLSDGAVIKGQFGTWAIKRFCDRRKLSFTQLQNMKTEEYGLDHVVDMILCAVEQKARKEKQPFSFTDVDVCDWIDEMGGITGEDIVRLFNHQGSEDPLPASQEKKTEVSSPGVDSKEHSTALVEP